MKAPATHEPERPVAEAGSGAAAGLRPMPLGTRALRAIAILAMFVIAVDVNLLASRFYRRLDLTTQGLFTLSAPTLETLRALEEPVEVLVFLGSSEPVTASVRRMLEAYGAETRLLQTRFVDPDQHPAEFMALRAKYRLAAGRSEQGEIATDAALVIAQGERTWFIDKDDVVRFDEELGRHDWLLERALTEGLRRVHITQQTRVCAASGYGERSLEDGGPGGLEELARSLRLNNYEVSEVDLAGARPDALSACDLLVVAGPKHPYPARTQDRVWAYLAAGGNAFLLFDPIDTGTRSISAPSSGALAERLHVELGGRLILERDPKTRLAAGAGETFSVELGRHAITERLVREGRSPARLLLSMAQGLTLSATANATTLAKTSAEAIAISAWEEALDVDRRELSERAPRGPFVVLAALELDRADAGALGAGVDTRSGAKPRIVVAGTSSLVANNTLLDPALHVNRTFVESAIAWLSATPELVSVPERSEEPIGLHLSEEVLGEVRRYVLVYMPGTAALVALFLLYRRRRGGKLSVTGGERALPRGRS